MDRFLVKADGTQYGAIRKEPTIPVSSKSVISSSDESDGSASEDESKNYKQKFRPHWKNLHKWLDTKEVKSYCVICKKILANNISNIKRHGEGESHKKRQAALRNQIKLSDVKERCYATKNAIKIAELKIILFLCIYDLPFTLISPLIELIKSVAANTNVIKGMKCGRTKAKETVTNVLHKNFVEKISDCLRNNKFSLIIDEATDVSSAKCLALVVRYFDKENGKIRDHFLSLIELDKSDSKTIFQSIKAFFERFKIPLTNLIGFAADNASVMMGQINGVQRLLKDINPHLYVTGCICHSMHLCSSKAAKAIPSKIENLVRDIYLFFNYSSKRQKEFVEFQNYFSLENHKILKVSNTRWLSMENAVSRVLEQWQALVHYFHLKNFEQNLDITNNILTNMNDANKCYLFFLAYILKEINKINLEFQSETPRFHVALEMLTLYFKNILSNFVDLNLLNFEMLTVDNFDQLSVFKPLKDIYLGPKAQSLLQSQNLTNLETIEIQQNCKQFYIILCKQILHRIDFKNPILNAVKILNPLSLGSSLMPLTTLFPNLVENGEHLELLESEWRLLILQNRSEEGLESFWKKMFCMKNSLGDLMYPNLKDFVGAILSLPHSSASPERVFSRMNNIKSFRRNCLDVGTVDSLLLVREMVTENEINSQNILREYKKS